jgi:hypothetical protein
MDEDSDGGFEGILTIGKGNPYGRSKRDVGEWSFGLQI